MSKELFALTYKIALENEDIDTLNQMINKIVEIYRGDAEHKKDSGKECLNIKNTQGNTAVMIAAKQGRTDMLEKWRNLIRGVSLKESKRAEIYKKSNCSDTTQDKDGSMGKISEKLLFVTEYSYALENKDVNILGQMLDELVKKYKSATADYKKELAKQCLDIFNSKNTQGSTAVMIAAEQGRADMLEEWYETPDFFIQSISLGPDELQEYYKQSNYSYITQDTECRNALMLACKSENPDCIKYILSPETKEILNQKDTNDKTPIEYAMKHKGYDEDMKNIMKAYNTANASNTKKVKQKGDISKPVSNETSGHNSFDEASNSKVLKKRSGDYSVKLEESSNKRLKTNSTTTTKTSKLLETLDSTHITKEEKSFTKKDKASAIKPAQTEKATLQDVDIDTSKVLANNLQKNAHKPETIEYNTDDLDKLDSFINKVNKEANNSDTDHDVLLSQFKELFCLPRNTGVVVPQYKMARLSDVKDSNIFQKMMNIIMDHEIATAITTSDIIMDHETEITTSDIISGDIANYNH